MAFNIFTMKRILPQALKIEWKYLGPVQLARFCSESSSKLNEREVDEEDYTADEKVTENVESKLKLPEKSINEVTLMGRIHEDPVIGKIGDRSTAEFTVITAQTFIDKSTGDIRTVKNLHFVTTRSISAVQQIEKYLRAGRRVYLTGRLIHFRTPEGIQKTAVRMKDFITLSY